ncbi:MAG TPA: hypothetical protein VLA46_08355 [Saprospiraceae bacterium]|nr:hypothetical protein [Saprospiraceae bacterium]
MKKHFMLMWLLLPPLVSTAQVGIGTETPRTKSILDLSSTTKGLLPPRLTGLQKSEMGLSTEDAGMLVFQTDNAQPPLPSTPKGLYYFDGTNWVVPVLNGTSNGQTLRWDGLKWASTSNLFNQGTSIGIGTQNPNTQLQIHSLSVPTTRLQLTNSGTGALNTDGLMLGVTLANSHAHLIQNENRPLWFGTNAVERMRIDSAGNVGVGVQNPGAKLDVNGTVRIGSSGTVLNGIMKRTMEIEIPPIQNMGENIVTIPFEGAIEQASVYVSPGSTMSGLMIGYARVCTPGNVEVKFINMSSDMEEPISMVLHISIIQ